MSETSPSPDERPTESRNEVVEPVQPGGVQERPALVRNAEMRGVPQELDNLDPEQIAKFGLEGAIAVERSTKPEVANNGNTAQFVDERRVVTGEAFFGNDKGEVVVHQPFEHTVNTAPHVVPGHDIRIRTAQK
jgi:hypothetical protein